MGRCVFTTGGRQVLRDRGRLAGATGLGKALEEGMGTHSCTHAWKSMWTEDLAGCSP